jgi:hypothetical protein
MKQRRPKAIYDKESQVLSWLLSNKKSVDSNIQANVVIDYDKAGKIVRINFYDFNFEDFKAIKKPIKHLTKQLVQV